MFVIQKSITRVICRKHRLHNSNPLFIKLGFLKLHDVYKLQVSKLVYKMKNNTDLPVGENHLTKVSDIHSYNTRHASKSNFLFQEKELG